MDDTTHDPFDELVEPKCPTCGTVLTSLRKGYHCRSCGLVYVDAIVTTLIPDNRR